MIGPPALHEATVRFALLALVAWGSAITLWFYGFLGIGFTTGLLAPGSFGWDYTPSGPLLPEALVVSLARCLLAAVALVVGAAAALAHDRRRLSVVLVGIGLGYIVVTRSLNVFEAGVPVVIGGMLGLRPVARPRIGT